MHNSTRIQARSMLLPLLGGLFGVACSSAIDTTPDATADATGKRDQAPPSTPDSGLACCPSGFSLYQCQQADGSLGLACHNPAQGCASSLMCGQGCDPQVSGRCQCPDNVLCIQGDHFDRTLCKCVPNQDAGTCIDNVLCIQGDHFDRTLCKCVPNQDAGTCIDNVLCIQGDHFDRLQCKCVPD